jgi:hypothetical protein
VCDARSGDLPNEAKSERILIGRHAFDFPDGSIASAPSGKAIHNVVACHQNAALCMKARDEFRPTPTRADFWISVAVPTLPVFMDAGQSLPFPLSKPRAFAS